MTAFEPRLPTLDDVRAAAKTIEGAVMRTPFLPAPRLSALTGAEVWVKYENLQVTNAFKERGALTKLLSLTPEERAAGVIAMSAGNHAQAVAYHATRLRIPSTIVMPVTTPHVKVTATRGFGAHVVLSGETVAEAEIEAARLAERDRLTFVHPYDDFDVIRGQGTVALEMIADVPELDVIVTPVGGGGLAGGIAVAAKGVKPRIEVVGVETRLYPSMWAELRDLPVHAGGTTLAEGIAVKRAGRMTLELARRLMDDLILVEESDIERAVNLYLTLQKTMAEGAAGAGLAALLAAPERFRSRKVGLILTGGNIDPRILSSIMVRELAREEKIVGIRMIIPDRPGVLGEITTVLGRMGGNVLEVEHHRTMLKVPAKGATLDVVFETRDGAHAQEIIAALEALDYVVERLDGPR
ncbi:threonine ammonia-lyase [Pinisolibacter aquiterrae]|uniref:threonine ammonia-lyase n=1 Tax=Pinisolibacter aquiterrae TaxID=2815579 RepID=UPI001C3DFD86|nr:threonine ammonia-lyase [Pinisolibacter aquiterrae]MBV5264145.1 threonine ammonia-lyase [Pinisolibacter aquiterrae]MCC8233761.1 threonine ammonia-lyase [Pinisolibacter aquiterrae]